MIHLNEQQLRSMADYVGSNMTIHFKDSTAISRKIDYQLISVFEREAMIKEVVWVQLDLRLLEDMTTSEVFRLSTILGVRLGNIIYRDGGYIRIDLLDREGYLSLNNSGDGVFSGPDNLFIPIVLFDRVTTYLRRCGFLFGGCMLPVRSVETTQRRSGTGYNPIAAARDREPGYMGASPVNTEDDTPPMPVDTGRQSAGIYGMMVTARAGELTYSTPQRERLENVLSTMIAEQESAITAAREYIRERDLYASGGPIQATNGITIRNQTQNDNDQNIE